MTVAIYALTEAGRIRYVGRALDPQARLRAHMVERGETPKCRWVEQLRRRGVRPGLRVLELVEVGEAARVELRWIRRLHRRGFELVNVQGCGRPRRPAAPARVRRSPAELLELARGYFGFDRSNDVR